MVKNNVLKEILKNSNKEHLMLDEEYFSILLNEKMLKMVIVGKDPYPNNAYGIPFYKERPDILNKNYSGYHLLYGLGIDVKLDDRDIKQIFYDLLNKDKIGFINASYYLLEKKKPNSFEKSLFKKLNNVIVNKAKIILTIKGAYKIQKLTYLNDNNHLICHPCTQARSKCKDEHEKLWCTKGGILIKYNIN